MRRLNAHRDGKRDQYGFLSLIVAEVPHFNLVTGPFTHKEKERLVYFSVSTNDKVLFFPSL